MRSPHNDPNVPISNVPCCIARNRMRLGLVYNRLGHYENAIEKGFKVAQYIMDQPFNDCTSVLLESLILEGMGEILLRQGKVKLAEKNLSLSIDKKEKVVGEASNLSGRALRAEARIRLGNLEGAYKDCVHVLNMEKTPRDNFQNLAYITCLYHAALIHYKKENLDKSRQHLFYFFEQMQLFCKNFLDKKVYDSFVLDDISKELKLSGKALEKSLVSYFEIASNLFSEIYGRSHPFVRDYITSNDFGSKS